MADARKRARRGGGDDPAPPPDDQRPLEPADLPPAEKPAVSEEPAASPQAAPPEPEPAEEDPDFDAMTFPADEPETASAMADSAGSRDPVPASAHAPAPPPPVSWVPRDEVMTFPAEAPVAPPKPGKLVLPASGLASDILAMAEASAFPVSQGAAPAAPLVTHDHEHEDASARHNISFFAPARDDRKAVEATEHLATFFLAGEEYGIDVRLVQEIIRVTDITQVPRAPEFIKGVINLRGRIIPVIDLKRKLLLGDVELAHRTARIVVVKVRDRLIGLLVDGASQVLRVPVSSIDAAPDEVVEIDQNAIRGVAKLKDRLIILMDLQKILSSELREGAAHA